MNVRTSIIGVALGALIALIPAAIAREKGYSFSGWWCYGFLIWIVAIPHALLLKPNPGSPGSLEPRTKEN